MSNTYLKELEKLNEELSKMTDKEIYQLFGSVEVNLEDAKQYAILERYIIESGVKEKK
jgi:hypothetical protein